jgi:hypothetical protein
MSKLQSTDFHSWYLGYIALPHLGSPVLNRGVRDLIAPPAQYKEQGIAESYQTGSGAGLELNAQGTSPTSKS